jgi:hypothetical protein
MSLKTRVESLATRIGTEFKTLRTSLTGNSSGALTALTTTDKTSLLAAINEVNAKPSGGWTAVDASETVKGIVELATTAEATTGTDSVRAVTPAGVKAVADALKASILGAGVPAALDTLDELAAALADDENFASTVTTALAGKQPLDADLTSIAGLTSAANKMLYATGAGTWTLADLTAAARTLLDDPDVATMRATLGVYSTTEIGDPETDFVAVFNAALV